MASMFFLVRIISCFLVLLPLGSLEFICPGPYYPPNGFSYARIELNISGRANVEYAKIRIKLSYDASIEGKPYQGLVQEATDFFTNALSVKPVDGRLYKPRDCESLNKPYYKISDVSGRREKYCLGSCATVTKCDEIEIPKEHLDGCKYCTQDGRQCYENNPEPGAGVNIADLVFYVASINTRTCSSGPIIAHAGPCELHPVSERPVFGIINICPTLAASNSIEKKTILTVMKHEMMHALGFQYNQFFKFETKKADICGHVTKMDNRYRVIKL